MDKINLGQTPENLFANYTLENELDIRNITIYRVT